MRKSTEVAKVIWGKTLNNCRNVFFVTALVCLIGVPSVVAAETQVKVWKEDVVIPTYLVGPPDPNPQFYFGGVSQGAQQRVYPYPLYDNLTTEKREKPYTVVYLENEYVKVGIIPELGGKVFEAIDKTNGYNFIYRQHVIKPALISLLGAWISGGIEWDIPHHHRASTFLPAQYTVNDQPDGSKTVWVGELELRDRMRWAVGVTLHPGKSYLEASFRIANRTPLPTTMLCFSNVAVSVNDSYQIIFPPSTQLVTYHTKNSFTTWPVATTQFAGTDFSAGVDVSWYKNHTNSTSMFAWNYKDDFFAGYDHGKNAGIMSIADHHYVPGKKFFTWGNSPAGHLEDKLLTDSDGPYIELMSGAYSDNQPDYSWLAPGEARSWTQYWYPFRDIDGVKSANLEGAVNLEVKDGRIRLGFYSTSDRAAAEITLRLKDQVLLHERTAIGPARPWKTEIALPAGADEHDLRASLSASGKELISYSSARVAKEPMPAPVTTPYPAPDKLPTNEELYLTGLRAEQFHSPFADPQKYWDEALRRDPGDIRVNTAMGIDCLRAGRFADAEHYLRIALERATKDYTDPKEGEPFYYLGLALKAQNRNEEAFDQFAKATWSAEWRSPGYLEMGEIASLQGDKDAALGYVRSSLESNEKSVRALALEAALLRGLGRSEDERAIVAKLKEIDPLDVHALAEQWLSAKSGQERDALVSTIRAFPQTALEVAADAMNAGLWEDGSAVLTLFVQANPDKMNMSALAYYDLGYLAQKANQPEKAREYFKSAALCPVDYVFPFQMEMIQVLEAAMAANPADARAPYYLGNLLYDWQPEKAVELWKESVSRGADFPVVYRNLALVESHKAKSAESRQAELRYLEKAVSLGGNAMVFEDLDKLYEENGVSPKARLASLEEHAAVVNRDDIIVRKINLEILCGHYDAAMALLKARFFRAWEGGGRFSLGNAWINANLLKGQAEFASHRYREALASYMEASHQPDNLQEATGDVSFRKAEISYFMGTAYAALGQMDKALDAYREASLGSITAPEAGTHPKRRQGQRETGGIASGTGIPASASYYQALAFEKLGQSDRAQILFHQLRDLGTAEAAGITVPSKGGDGYLPRDVRIHLGDAHYLAALGYIGLGDRAKANAELSEALKMSPDYLMAKVAVETLGAAR